MSISRRPVTSFEAFLNRFDPETPLERSLAVNCAWFRKRLCFAIAVEASTLEHYRPFAEDYRTAARQAYSESLDQLKQAITARLQGLSIDRVLATMSTDAQDWVRSAEPDALRVFRRCRPRTVPRRPR